MLKRIYKSLAYLLVFLLPIPFVFLLTIPKFLIIDNLLQSSGVFALYREVKEGLTYVEVRDAELFADSEKVASLKSAKVEITPMGILLKGTCKKGKVEVFKNLLSGALEMELDNFSCINRIGSVSGELEVKHGLEGSLLVKALELPEIKLEEMRLNFEGKKVHVYVKSMGVELKGEVKLKLNKENLMASEISGRLKGKTMSLIVSGTLGRPRVRQGIPPILR